MDIKLNLNKSFVACLNKLREKYGEEFEKINGFHNSNLNFTDFIDKFVDSHNVADVTIDANANSNTHDIRTLMSDMMKPHTKLLAANKIFYEITKKYGIQTAEDWFEQEWCGGLYLHDFPSATFMPYCYKGEEFVTVKYCSKIYNLSFIDLYDLVKEQENYDELILQYVKYPKDLYVLDIVDEKEVYTKVTRILRHANEINMMFVKLSNGYSQIVTENHTMITDSGEIECKNLTNKNSVYSVKPSYFKETIHEIKTKKGIIPLNNDIGWIVGMALSEGNSGASYVTIHQKIPSDTSSKLISLFNKYNIPFSIFENRKFNIKVCPLEIWMEELLKNNTSDKKRLPEDYCNYNNEFLDGVVAGIIDGDGTIDGYKNRHCQIRVSSERMARQISNYLSYKGIFCSDRIPFRYFGKNSFNQNLLLYGVSFPISNNYFASIGSLKISKKYIKPIRMGSFHNLKYNYSYGKTSILENKYLIDDVPIVYDITTDTGHFLCNNILSHNCYAYDIKDIVEKGLFFINKFKTESPKHLTTFNDHILEFISWASNRTSGAVGLPSYLVWSYYFWQHDIKNNFYLKDPEYYRRQCFQKFVYDLNQPYLRITECAFTNISIMDRPYLTELFGGIEFPDGEFVIDHIDDIIEHQKVFMEVVSKVRSETLMTFPVLTYSLLYKDGKFVDEDFAKWCNRHNMDWFDSNFYIGSDVASLSSCCRMVNDTSKLDAFINSIGGTALSIGSIKVNTINLRKIALESKNNEEKFLSVLEDRVVLCEKVLDIIRSIIKRDIEKGLLPNYTYGLIELSKQYNTIGITAMYEALSEFGYINTDSFGNKTYSENAMRFAKTILNKINSLKDEFTLDKDYSENVECIPAERANVVLAKKDSLLFPESQQYEIYSNQWIPLVENCTINEKIRLGAELDKECGGGQISHVNVQGKFANEEQSWKMLNKIASSGVIYFAYNAKISVCEEGHGFFGNICPKCGKEMIDTFQRIVGYLVPSSSYGKERRAEFLSRKWYDLNDN